MLLLILPALYTTSSTASTLSYTRTTSATKVLVVTVLRVLLTTTTGTTSTTSTTSTTTAAANCFVIKVYAESPLPQPSESQHAQPASRTRSVGTLGLGSGWVETGTTATRACD